MKKMYLVGVLAAVMMVFSSGCATLNRLLPDELQETKTAIDEARARGADQRCPEDYRQVVSMWYKAKELYVACQSKEAFALARAATERARVLCTATKDSDGDGVFDDLDQCPATPKGVKVDQRGCPLDSDGDGVFDYQDKCPGTPAGVAVNASGCPLDSDGDGIYDYLDRCANTPKGVKVDQKGCPLDSDADTVYDYLDQCPGTPWGAKVDERGCWVIRGTQFQVGSSEIRPSSYPALNEIADVLEKNPSVKLEVAGHTDSTGSAALNQRLSEQRAQAVLEYLVSKGIDRDRLSAKGYGLTKPIATNATPQGRAKNRRVELHPVY